MTGNQLKSCPICTEGKRSDKLSRHLSIHVPEIIGKLSEAKLTEHLSTKNPILIGKQPHATDADHTWNIVRFVFCTVCRVGLFDTVHSKDKIKSWYTRHLTTECSTKFDTIKYLFETKGKAVIYKPPPAKPKPKETTATVVQKSCKDHEDQIEALTQSRDDYKEDYNNKKEDYDILEADAYKTFEAIHEALETAKRLIEVAHTPDDLIHPLDYKKKLIAVLAPLYDLANYTVNKDD